MLSLSPCRGSGALDSAASGRGTAKKLLAMALAHEASLRTADAAPWRQSVLALILLQWIGIDDSQLCYKSLLLMHCLLSFVAF